MVMLVILGVLLFGAAIALLARSVAMPHVRVSTQMRQIGDYGFHAEHATDPAPRQSLLVSLIPLAERVGARFSGTGMLAPLEGIELRVAGIYRITPEAFHGLRTMAAIVVPSALLGLALIGGTINALLVVCVLTGAVCCWLLPPAMVRSRGQRRMDELDRALPELIDVLIATVEAGLGFAGSLRLVSGRFEGPLGQELRLTQQEQSMGLSTEQAMTNMLSRCDTPSLRAFVRAVTQGESLGVSIGAMLRNLAGETRKRRRQTAREKIMKVPVKILFPLVFFIFPSLFIVLLYPAITETLKALGG